jgi:hypothetical protein
VHLPAATAHHALFRSQLLQRGHIELPQPRPRVAKPLDDIKVSPLKGFSVPAQSTRLGGARSPSSGVRIPVPAVERSPGATVLFLKNRSALDFAKKTEVRIFKVIKSALYNKRISYASVKSGVLSATCKIQCFLITAPKIVSASRPIGGPTSG